MNLQKDANFQLNQVPIHEWLAISILSMILVFYALYSSAVAPSLFAMEKNAKQNVELIKPDRQPYNKPYVTIYLEGGILCPGVFTVKQPTTLGQLLAEISCKEGIRTDRLDLTHVLIDQEAFYIPYKSIGKKNKKSKGQLL